MKILPVISVLAATCMLALDAHGQEGPPAEKGSAAEKGPTIIIDNGNSSLLEEALSTRSPTDSGRLVTDG